MTTADEHASEAELSLAAADREWEAMDRALQDGRELLPEQEEGGWREIRRHQLDAIARALLSLRPAPAAPVPSDGELPTRQHAVVRATINGTRTVIHRMADTPVDAVPWRSVGGNWYADDELTDVEVLFPGVPS